MRIHVRRVPSPNSHLGGHVLLPRITCVIIVIISILSTIIIILMTTILSTIITFIILILTINNVITIGHLSKDLDKFPLLGGKEIPMMSPRMTGGGSW